MTAFSKATLPPALRTPILIRKFYKLLSGSVITALIFGLLAGCTASQSTKSGVSANHSSKSGPKRSYSVRGTRYYLVENAKGFVQEGLASWYGSKFHGRKTSNQEVYDMHAMTAAHKTLPFNTRVRVLNLENQREITVRINDRGPFIKGRIIDVSYAAAKKLLLTKNGIAKVRIKVVPTPQKQLSNLHESSNTLAIAGRNKNNLLRNWDLNRVPYLSPII